MLRCCVHALGSEDEDMLLRVVQPLDHLLASDPASSLEVMATAVGYMPHGWSRLPDKLGSTLCLVAVAILPQLQVRNSSPICLFSRHRGTTQGSSDPHPVSLPHLVLHMFNRI